MWNPAAPRVIDADDSAAAMDAADSAVEHVSRTELIDGSEISLRRLRPDDGDDRRRDGSELHFEIDVSAAG